MINMPLSTIGWEKIIEFSLNDFPWIQRIQWIMTKSKTSMVTRSITHLPTDTLPVLVIQSVFSLLPLIRYPLPITTPSRYQPTDSSGKLLYTTISRNVTFIRCRMSLITILLLDLVMIHWIQRKSFRENSIERDQVINHYTYCINGAAVTLVYTTINLRGVVPSHVSCLRPKKKKTWWFYWVWDQQQQQVTGLSQNWDWVFTGRNEVLAKVIFSQACVILFTGGVFFWGGFLQIFGGCLFFGGGGSTNFWGGVFFWGGSIKFSGGCLFWGGIPPNFRGVCLFWGVPPNFYGGGVFFSGGSSKFSGGSSKFSGGGVSPSEYGQRSAGMHPTGMHSCFVLLLSQEWLNASHRQYWRFLNNGRSIEGASQLTGCWAESPWN